MLTGASSFAIGAVDSWFGTVVQAVQIALVVPGAASTYSFGRSLNPQQCAPGSWSARSCPSNPQEICQYPCSITNWTALGQERQGIYHAQQAAETLMSNSQSNTIFNVTRNGSNYFFLGDIRSSPTLDFAAEALTVSTQCQMITPNCTVNSEGGFTCGTYTSPSFSYSGEVGVDPENATSAMDEAMVGIQFFNDSALTQPVGFGSNATDLFAPKNPIHFLSWSKGFPPVDTYADEFGYMRYNGYLKNDTNGDAVFVMACSATIYETEYYWVNGSVISSELEAYEVAPDYYGAVYSAPFAINSALSHLALQDAAALAAYQLRPEGLSRVFADYFSKAAVSFSSGISVPILNDKEWTRDNFYLATRVPFVPLYTLIALKALYAIFAIGIAVLAVFFTRPSEAQEVKERLTVNGLAAGFFEPYSSHVKPVEEVSELFQEHHGPKKSLTTQKIGLFQTEQGGWLWVSVAKKMIAGLGIHESMMAVPGSPQSFRNPASPNLGEGYTPVKDVQ